MYQKQSPQSSTPSRVHKLIGKPKQLIQKMSLNKVYAQEWDFPVQATPLACSVILNSSNNSNKQKLAMEMQYRNSSKSMVRKNVRFGKNGLELGLSELEESGGLGVLIFERVKRNNWVWQIKPCEHNISQAQLKNCSPLTFNTNFQSSNLLRVYTPNSKTFFLLTQNDTNTQGYNQWFYFAAKSQKPFETVRLQIINLRKKYSCYEKGMKIAIFSEQKYRTEKLGWHRGGNNIQYCQNQIKGFREEFNSLGWDYTFEKAGQWTYFAYSYPYTYSDLRHVIKKTKKIYRSAEWSSICLTPLKNEVYVLKIVDKQAIKREQSLQSIQQDTSPSATSKSTNLSKNKRSKFFQKPNQNNKQMRDIQEQTIQHDHELYNSYWKNQNIKQAAKGFDKRNIVLRFNKMNFNRLPAKNRQWSLTQALNRQSSKAELQHKFEQVEETQDAMADRNISLSKGKKPIKINIQKKRQKQEQKDILVIMGRSHPGETPSSFVIDGIIDSLLSQKSSQTKYLSNKLQIYIIPMLNPDGVIHGNTRTSLTGNDLNRRWSNPNPILHPEPHKIKKFFKQLKQQGKQIFAMVDIHGHTKKESAFFYGCCDRTNYHNHAQVKLLNVLFGKADSNFNMLYSSHFVSEGKRSTARVTFFKEFQCYAYTLENSFLGACDGSFHFSAFDYYNMGANLLKSLAYFHASTKKKIKNCNSYAINEIMLNNSILRKAIIDHYERFKVKSNKQQDQQNSQKQSEGGSSSAPSQHNFTQQFLLESIFQRQKADTRYRTKSFNKVGRHNMSLSIEDKPKIAQPCTGQQQKNEKNKSQSSKMSIGNRKSEMSNKLPLLAFQSKQEQSNEYEFQAFNFKSKKTSTKNWTNNVGVGMGKGRKLMLGFDYTIQ